MKSLKYSFLFCSFLMLLESCTTIKPQSREDLFVQIVDELADSINQIQQN